MTNLITALVCILVQVESQNRNVYGDDYRAAGILQMRPIAVREANRITGRNWTTADRWSRAESRAMCAATLEWHYRRGVRSPVALACRWRNPNGITPRWYRERIRKEVEKATR